MANPKKEKAVKRAAVADFPVEILPKMDKTLGTATPEVVEFVKKYSLSPEEQKELIKRIERM